MPDNYAELGGLGIIFVFAVKEFFGYLKSKKNGDSDNGSTLILKELTSMNDNHLHSIREAIEKGNERLVDVIHTDNTQIISLLSELKGRLK